MVERTLFEAALKQEVAIRFEPDEVRTGTISEVIKLGGNAQQADRPFAVSFSLPRQATYYPQGIYKVLHPQWGEEMDIFLVPLGPTANGENFIYEAIFS